MGRRHYASSLDDLQECTALNRRGTSCAVVLVVALCRMLLGGSTGRGPNVGGKQSLCVGAVLQYGAMSGPRAVFDVRDVLYGGKTITGWRWYILCTWQQPNALQMHSPAIRTAGSMW